MKKYYVVYWKHVSVAEEIEASSEEEAEMKMKELVESDAFSDDGIEVNEK